MTPQVPYEDAIDLLDADHKAVKKHFIDYDALCEDQASPEERQALALKICSAITLHAELEETLFYPAVRAAIRDDALMDEALQEHDEAKQQIARIEGMTAAEAGYDDAVRQLAKMIDQHVLEEREQVFLKARLSPLDLRALAVPLYEQQQAGKQAAARQPAKKTAKTRKEATA